MKIPKISIITVVWNDAVGLERTILSVIDQTYNNIELIVIDGQSTDGTVAVIKKYDDKIDYWVSEKDKGIYDAMNKGIKASSGTWINFMNAGDTFVHSKVIDKINWNNYKDVSLLYGNKIQDQKIVYPFDIKYLKCGEIMGCHQAMFFNKLILKSKLYYDISFKIYADYELVNKIYIQKHRIQYVNYDIAIFEGGGISSTISIQKRKDKYIVLYREYGTLGIVRGLLFRIFGMCFARV